MANWCTNYLTSPDIEKLFPWFSNMVNADEGVQIADKGIMYLFDVYVGDDFISFETKWTPPLEDVEKLSDKLGIKITHEYYEPGMYIYGTMVCKNGISTITELEESDFNQYYYDEDGDCYVFENEFYESNVEILEILLSRK